MFYSTKNRLRLAFVTRDVYTYMHKLYFIKSSIKPIVIRLKRQLNLFWKLIPNDNGQFPRKMRNFIFKEKLKKKNENRARRQIAKL